MFWAYLNEGVIGGEHHEGLCRLVFVLRRTDPFHHFTLVALVGLLPNPLFAQKEFIIIIGDDGGRESPGLWGQSIERARGSVRL